MFDPTASIPRLPLWIPLVVVAALVAMMFVATYFWGQRGAFWATVVVLVLFFIRSKMVFQGPLNILGPMIIVGDAIMVGVICLVGWAVWRITDRFIGTRQPSAQVQLEP